MKANLIRTNTVISKKPHVDSRLRYEKERVPLICISGMRLKDYGFEVGRRFEVYARKNQLLLKAREFKYGNPKTKKRR